MRFLIKEKKMVFDKRAGGRFLELIGDLPSLDRSSMPIRYNDNSILKNVRNKLYLLCNTYCTTS